MKLFNSFLMVLLVISLAACTSKTESKENIDTQKPATEEPALVKKNKQNPATRVSTASTPNNSRAAASVVNWMSINDVESAMKKEKRKVMVDLYTDWCGWCKRMDKATFQNPEIAKQLNAKFYAVKFDAEDQNTISFKGADHKFVPAGRKGYNQLAHKFANGKMSYPTIAFLDEDLQRINSYPGFKNAQQFDPLLRFIDGDHYKSKSLSEFAQGFKSNVTNLPTNGQVQLTRKGAGQANIKRIPNAKNGQTQQLRKVPTQNGGK